MIDELRKVQDDEDKHVDEVLLRFYCHLNGSHECLLFQKGRPSAAEDPLTILARIEAEKRLTVV